MTFALITEGISEHRIIRHILTKYFKESDPDINQIQPKILNDKQASVGSWNEVLKYCERDNDLKNIFVDNDYLIIQIDTDQSQTEPFDISHTKPDSKSKSVEELHADVVEKLKGLFNPEILEAFNQRIFFAICIHTIECWLLPIYCTNHHQSDIRNCVSTLNTELRKRNMDVLAQGNKNNAVSVRAYDTILRTWKKKQDIMDAAQHNAGFKIFTDELKVVKTSAANF